MKKSKAGTPARVRPPVYREFPFRPGTKPGSAHIRRAEDALAVFEVLHDAYQNKKLTLEQLAPLFFRSTSDLISYREGWKAGKYWSKAAWAQATANKNTNGLVSEHVLPRSVTLAHALTLPIADAKIFVWTHSFECVITKAEDREVNKHTATPDDPWKRYADAGVQILDVYYPENVPFLTDEDRELFRKHQILATA